MGSPAPNVNLSEHLGLEGSECLWGIDIENLTGSSNIQLGMEGPSADEESVVSGSKLTTMRSLNYGLPGLVVVSSVLVFFVVATAFGNCLVIVALIRYRSLRTISNFLIGNLALSDLLLAVTILPLSSVNECLGHWVFGRLACNVWLTMDVLYCTASIWNLCVIAFDRFTATLYPLWYHEKRSTKQAAVYVLFIWSISGAICVPPALGWGELSQNYFHNNSTDVFECVLFQSPGYVLYSASGSFYIPFLITFFLYVRIFSLLRKRMRKMRRGYKPGASRCQGCCTGDRLPTSSAERNGYQGCGQSALGDSSPPLRRPQYSHSRAETRMCLDVPKLDTGDVDGFSTKAYSSCRSQEKNDEDAEELVPRVASSWHRNSKRERRPGIGLNIPVNSHSIPLLPALPASTQPLPPSTGNHPFTLVLNGTAASPIIVDAPRGDVYREQGKDCRRRSSTQTEEPCRLPVGHSMDEEEKLDDGDSPKTKTLSKDVCKSHESVSLRFPVSRDPSLLHLPATSRHSYLERTSPFPGPSFALLPVKSGNLATYTTAQECSSTRRACGSDGLTRHSRRSDVTAGVTRHSCDDDAVTHVKVGVAIKEGGNMGVTTKEGEKMGVAISEGRKASCLQEESMGRSGNRPGDTQVGVAANEGVGVARCGSTEDLGCVQKRGLNSGGVSIEGGKAPIVKIDNQYLGVATGVARSVSADFSFVKTDWDLSGVGIGNGRVWDDTKSVGGATKGVANLVVGGTLGGVSGPGLCRRRRRRRPDLRETNATIKMAIIIAFFCGMWVGFFVVYVVRGWCPVSCHVPRKLEAFFFWLGYSNSSMNPILYTLFNDDFRKAFQKLLGCYLRRSCCCSRRNSRY